MSRRFRSLLIVFIAAPPALLPGGREACAQQVGSLVKTQDLSFGRIVAGTAGSVTVTPAGTFGPPNGVITLNSPAPTAAKFSATVVKAGNSNKGKISTVSFTLPSSIQLTSGANSMTVDTFVASPASAPVSLGSAAVVVSVGATLRVSATQKPGTYSGSFSVIGNFN